MPIKLYQMFFKYLRKLHKLQILHQMSYKINVYQQKLINAKIALFKTLLIQ